MARLTPIVDPARLDWRCPREWGCWDWEREDGLRITLANHPVQQTASVAINPRRGRPTAAHAAQVEHLLGLAPGELRRRHPRMPEFDAPFLPVLAWLTEARELLQPRPAVYTGTAPTRSDPSPSSVLCWHTRPLQLTADCDPCGLHARFPVRPLYPPAPDDFARRARAAEQVARERLLACEPWRRCPHLPASHVNSIALYRVFEPLPPSTIISEAGPRR